MTEKILVVSTYPPFGSLHNHPFSAVAFYTKNTLLFSIKNNPDLSFLVLADELEGEKKESKKDHIEVVRCWQRNKPLIFFVLFKKILAYPKTKKVVFTFEWAMFGKKKWLLGFLPFFLILLKIINKKVYFVSHGVLLDANLVSEQMGVARGSIKAKLWSVGLRILYLSIVLLSHKTIVFEEYLRQRLLSLANFPNKITTIPFGVEKIKTELSYQQSRENLKIAKEEFVVMCFGYLTWYKGSDWLVEEMGRFFKENPQSRVRLFMVGGPTKTYEKDDVYQRFVNKIFENARKFGSKIVITGFIKEEKIAQYYTAADLIVLPYRVFISSSGPLSLAFSYRKPVIISESLANYCLTEDFKASLEEAKLKIEDLTFTLENEDLKKKIISVEKDANLIKKNLQFVRLMGESRDWLKIGNNYTDLLKD